MKSAYSFKLDASILRWVLCLASILGAAWVGASGHDGWGWFLFFAFLVAF
jgi:hypothetical protein